MKLFLFLFFSRELALHRLKKMSRAGRNQNQPSDISYRQQVTTALLTMTHRKELNTK